MRMDVKPPTGTGNRFVTDYDMHRRGEDERAPYGQIQTQQPSRVVDARMKTSASSDRQREHEATENKEHHHKLWARPKDVERGVGDQPVKRAFRGRQARWDRLVFVCAS